MANRGITKVQGVGRRGFIVSSAVAAAGAGVGALISPAPAFAQTKSVPLSAEGRGPMTTRQVAEAWFSSLEQNKLLEAQALLDENVLWENIPVTPGVSDLAPWLGTYRGVPAVMKSIEVWAKHARLLSFKLLRLMVDGPEAVGIVREHAQCVANNNEYVVHAAENIRVEGGKITHYRVYWDISPLIKAFRNINP
jgi:ketosteroid isomerase-like protein